MWHEDCPTLCVERRTLADDLVVSTFEQGIRANRKVIRVETRSRHGEHNMELETKNSSRIAQVIDFILAVIAQVAAYSLRATSI